MRYMLDTNIVSALMREPRGSVAERIRTVGEANVCTSIIVAAELRNGAAKKGSPRLQERLELILGVLDVLPFEAPADAIYGEVRTQLERAGKRIGGNDLLIASQALANDCIVVTDNQRELERVAGLRVENWIRDV